MAQQITHDRIMQLATGFWASKTFLSAIELRVFGAFDGGPLGLDELRKRLGLHERSARDFFDALVALHLLERDETGRYRNSEEAELFLSPAKPVLDPAEVAQIVAPDGKPRTVIDIRLPDRRVSADLNAKSVRKAVAAISEYGPDGVAVIIQGKLVGNAMTEAGIVAQPKVRPQTTAEAA